jgi:hypothetical protein
MVVMVVVSVAVVSKLRNVSFKHTQPHKSMYYINLIHMCYSVQASENERCYLMN